MNIFNYYSGTLKLKIVFKNGLLYSVNVSKSEIKYRTTFKKYDHGLVNILDKYFAGEKVDFGKIEIDYSGFSYYEQSVLKALRSIGYGYTISYGGLAELSGSPRSARAVGNTLAKNRVPIIIPCHRVIKNNGDIGGFSCGIDIKRYLLNLEK